jgi:hypothetical protein
LVCKGNETHEWVSGAFAMFTPPQVSDVCDTNPVVTRTEDELPASCPAVRVFRCTWTATDANGNHASCSQIITFVDTTRPNIVCPQNLRVQSLANVPPRPTSFAAFIASGGGAADTCDPALSYSCSDGPLIGGTCGGTIRRTHTVTDDCNNSTSCDQIITVQDCPNPPPHLMALDSLGAGKMEIMIEGQLNRSYLIEGTENFLNWRSIATVLNTDGKLRFTDSAATSKCFYRVTMMPQ